MSKNAARESELGELHAKVAKVMSRAIDQIDRAQDLFDVQAKAYETLPPEELAVQAPIEPPQLSAPLMGVMTKFLADNSITCAPEASEEMSGLAKALAEKKKKRGVNLDNILPFPETA